MFILNKNGKVVAKKETPRGAGTAARDWLYANLPLGNYAIVLSTNKTSRKKVHVYVDGYAKLIDKEPAGSIGAPATAKKSLSVGAWDVYKQHITD